MLTDEYVEFQCARCLKGKCDWVQSLCMTTRMYAALEEYDRGVAAPRKRCSII